MFPENGGWNFFVGVYSSLHTALYDTLLNWKTGLGLNLQKAGYIWGRHTVILFLHTAEKKILSGYFRYNSLT